MMTKPTQLLVTAIGQSLFLPEVKLRIGIGESVWMSTDVWEASMTLRTACSLGLVRVDRIARCVSVRPPPRVVSRPFTPSGTSRAFMPSHEFPIPTTKGHEDIPLRRTVKRKKPDVR